MPAGPIFLSPAEAARRLGVSIKALRLYEKHGLLKPARSAAGWRVYSPGQMSRAADIVTLRKLGFALARIARMLAGDTADLDTAIAEHHATLESRMRSLGDTTHAVRILRAKLARGATPSVGALRDALDQTLAPQTASVLAFDLPWPWGGERFELPALRALTYITGPLGSGKTRLAMRIADAVPGAVFVDLDRARDPAAMEARLHRDDALRARVDSARAWLLENGASASDDLIALLSAIEAPGAAEAPHAPLVIDLIEQGLDEATQHALAALLRRRGPDMQPLVIMTRSTAILDLARTAPDTLIIFCPANHSPPVCIAACPATLWPGAQGYDAIASCLAPPDVRARTRGMVALMPGAA